MRRQVITLKGYREFPAVPSAPFFVWYDFSDASTVVLDGSSNIQTVKDKGGNGYDVTQSDTARRPAQTTVNGLLAGSFDSAAKSGAGDWLQSAAFPSVSPPFTMFVVASCSLADDTHFPKFFAIGDYLFMNGPFNHVALQVGAGNIAIALTTPFAQQQFTAVTNGASSSIRLNGAETDGNPGVSGTSTIVSLGHYQGGVNDSGHRDGLTGALCECLGYQGALSTADRDSVEAYLKAKWATP